MSLLQTAAILGSIAASAYAHGHVSGIVVDGTYYTGYDPSFQYQATPPSVIGWSDPEDLGNGFIAPSAYSTADIICHLGATPGKSVAKVAAGGKVTLQWTAWPESHHGPVLDYLAKCAGDDCTTVDKTALEFFKIGEVGLVDDSTVPGTWGSDQLIANNNSWTATIPTSIAPGQYVLRHEIIALHSAGQADGAQNYPQCINIEVTGSGTASPAGVVGTKLYTNVNAPGILVNIYTTLASYVIPGPALYSGASSGSQSTVAASSAAATSSVSAAAKPATSTAAAAPSSSAIATTSYAAPTSTAATSSQAAPATTSAPAAGATETTTCVSTVTVQTSVTASAYASVVTSAPAAAISDIASALPSSVLTATISTALPSAASYGNSQASGSAAPGYPSKPLPAGFTLKDLLEWVSYLLSQSFSEASVHARDFGARR